MVTNAILDRMPYMVWTYDALGSLDFVNASWKTYTGLALSESLHPTRWDLLLDDDDKSAFVSALQSALSRGESFRQDIRLKHRDDGATFRWHTINLEPSKDNDGASSGWIGTAVDIDDRHLAIDALRERELQYQRERENSMLFQRAALPPRLPTVPGLSFDAVYEPGLSDVQVGGDWYDAVRLLDGRVMLAIGDVSGSGLQAAVIMGVVRQIIRGIAQLHLEPAVMLDAADRALRIEYPDVLVTAWVGIIDLIAHTVTFASAGHPPPLLLETNGNVTELDHLTLPIGLRQGHQGRSQTIPLPDGSALWLYTDGLIEATKNIIEGCDKLYATARAVGPANLDNPAATIRRLVIPNGSPDDVAILVVRTDYAKSEHFLRRWHFDSSDGIAARDARLAFIGALPVSQFSDIDIANAEIVFGELCGNVTRHAPGTLDVVLDLSHQQFVLHVADRGSGFRHFSRLPRDVFAEKGRGLFLIEAMTTEFTVTQRHGGGSEARAVIVGRLPVSLLRGITLPAVSDQVPTTF